MLIVFSAMEEQINVNHAYLIYELIMMVLFVLLIVLLIAVIQVNLLSLIFLIIILLNKIDICLGKKYNSFNII